MGTERERISILRFSMPIVFENLLATSVSQVFNALVGGISYSSLTAIAQCNMVGTILAAISNILVIGAQILCSRMEGAGDIPGASRVVEQSLFLMIVGSAAVSVLLFIGAVPTLRLIMPNADRELLSDAKIYFRIIMLSMPSMLIYNLLQGTIRNTGDSRTPMIVNIAVYAVMLGGTILFVRVLKMGVAGAGLSMLLCRMVGAVFAYIMILHNRRYHIISRNIFRPQADVSRRIFRLGLPASLESVFVQLGYLLGNSLVIGLGAYQAAVYNVANSLYGLSAVPQGIFSTISLTVVGQLIGAKDYKAAKKTGWKLWAAAEGLSVVLALIVLALRYRLAPLYAADAEVQIGAAQVTLFSLMLGIPGASLNSLDPQLRVGGDVRYVMIVTMIAVWAIRLPLTWLFCYHWTMGAAGVFLANMISLCFRMILNMIRYIKGKYLYMQV